MRKCRGRSSTNTTTSATSSAVIIPGSTSGVRPRPSSSAKSVATPPGQTFVQRMPVLAQLVVERAREADLAELRGAVDGLERQPAPAGLGGERDHVALAAEHVRQRGADGVERALQVHVDHLVEVLLREVEERPVRADARVRDEDVDAAEALGGRVAERGRAGARSRTSHGCATTPSRPRSSPLRDARPRFTPRSCSSRATAAPMPRLAPVITAVLPSRLMSSSRGRSAG